MAITAAAPRTVAQATVVEDAAPVNTNVDGVGLAVAFVVEDEELVPLTPLALV